MPARTKKTTLPPPSTAGVPTAEFILKVTQFRDIIVEKGAVTPYLLLGGKSVPKVRIAHGHFQKNDDPNVKTTIQVDDASVVILRFKIVDQHDNEGVYRPVGIAFARADNTSPIAIPCTTSAQMLPGSPPGSPFYALKLNEPLNTIQITDKPIPDLPTIDPRPNRTHTTYRFSVFIEEVATGRLGVIDPEVENLN